MWKVEFTTRFLKELSKLPEHNRQRAEKIVFEELLTDNPFSLGYIERMKGYTGKFKIRIGDYRIGLTIDNHKRTIICMRIAHRREIYHIFP
jgi:mRNA interferase RelE/StbE